jgi:hypothetical protein
MTQKSTTQRLQGRDNKLLIKPFFLEKAITVGSTTGGDGLTHHRRPWCNGSRNRWWWVVSPGSDSSVWSISPIIEHSLTYMVMQNSYLALVVAHTRNERTRGWRLLSGWSHWNVPACLFIPAVSSLLYPISDWDLAAAVSATAKLFLRRHGRSWEETDPKTNAMQWGGGAMAATTAWWQFVRSVLVKKVYGN